jgi:hypothetical protein
MDSISPSPIRSDAVVTETAPRPTPTPVRVSFSDVVAAGAGTLANAANAALQTLPGSSLMAVAVRGPAGGGTVSIGGVGSTSLAEGPSGIGAPTGQTSGVGVSVGGVSIGAPTGSSTATDPASALAQSQASNLYYLQLQAQMNAQSTQYTALTNVMKTEYDTVKTAIGNIH